VRTRAAADPRSFDALLRVFLEDLRVSHYSLSSQEHARLVLPRLFDHLRDERIRDVRRVGEAQLVAYARRLATAPTASGALLSLSAQASYLGTIRRFFSFLEGRSVILRNPTRTLPLPRVRRLPRAILSEGQARRLMNAPSPWSVMGRRDRAILETLYGSGLRLGECVRIVASDLDLWDRTLLVRNGKGKKDRMVPVTGRAAIALDVYLKESRPELLRDPKEAALFLTREGRQMGMHTMRLMMKRHAVDARIPGRAYPHLLRHACATHLLQGGADIRHVQELLGHARLETTALYTRVLAEDLRRVVARSHPRERTWRRRGAR